MNSIDTTQEPLRGGHSGVATMPKSFFGKHSRGLSFVGALIVFVTFIVKEGFSDHWKDEASGISAAEYKYSFRSESSDLTDGLQYVSGRLNDPSWAVHFLDGPMSSEVNVELTKDVVEQHAVGTALKNLDTLIEDLPHDIIFHQDWVDTKKVFEKAEKQFEDRLVGIQENIYRAKMTDPAVKVDYPPEKALAETLGNTGDVLRLSGLVRGFASNIIDIADYRRKENEERSNYAWWIAAFLYAIGWGLAVAARLHDKPAFGE